MANMKLKVKALTWNRESNGLFDYESKSYSKTTFKLLGDSYIIRQSDRVSSISPSSELSALENARFLAFFTKSGSRYTLRPMKSSYEKGLNVDHPWLVIRSLKNSEYILSEGDTVRLGKVKLKIREIGLEAGPEIHKNRQFSSKSISAAQNAVPEIPCSNEYTEPRICRICLMEDSNSENPLLSPCSCTGTMGTVHLNCLQHWLSSKIMHQDGNLLKVYKWRSLECELCKHQFSSQIFFKDTIFDLISVEKPSKNYVVFETVQEDMQQLSVLSFEERSCIRIGRGNESELRFTDISVSRAHAVLTIRNNSLILQDLDSKFGSLIKVKKDTSIAVGGNLQLQCGKTLLNLTVQRPWSFIGCFGHCGKAKDSDEDLPRTLRNIDLDKFPNV